MEELISREPTWKTSTWNYKILDSSEDLTRRCCISQASPGSIRRHTQSTVARLVVLELSRKSLGSTFVHTSDCNCLENTMASPFSYDKSHVKTSCWQTLTWNHTRKKIVGTVACLYNLTCAPEFNLRSGERTW